MDFSNFLIMRQELGLLAVFLVLLIFDLFVTETRAMRWFRLVAILLFAVHTAAGFLYAPQEASAFGGMYLTSDLTVMMKNILNVATLIVLMQAGEWLRRGEAAIREGEFYVIAAAALFGMYLMISAGNFMMLYIGIETASLPVACLAAYNKYREKSAEAGAKYILMTALSSGVMMFGLSYLYGAMGTMYFDDMGASLAANPMTILGFVFFFAGLAFKISLVPFHMWAPDVYEGAPTATTAFLSVVSKGAAVFALLLSLHHVFGTLAAPHALGTDRRDDRYRQSFRPAPDGYKAFFRLLVNFAGWVYHARGAARDAGGAYGDCLFRTRLPVLEPRGVRSDHGRREQHRAHGHCRV